MSTRAVIFPFGYEDNQDLLNLLDSDSMKILDFLPTYEIASKAQSFNLSDSDIDDNFVNNINSKYYSVQDFKSAIQTDSSLSIFHTNLNGLENKFSEFNHFISTTQNNL